MEVISIRELLHLHDLDKLSLNEKQRAFKERIDKLDGEFEERLKKYKEGVKNEPIQSNRKLKK